jgi:hypothetical protein
VSRPYLLPWVRVLLLIRSITSTTWGHEAWPQVKPVLRRALEMRGQIAGGLVELAPAASRLRAAPAAGACTGSWPARGARSGSTARCGARRGAWPRAAAAASA